MNPEPPLNPPSTLAESQHKTTHKQAVNSGRGYILAIAILQLLAGVVFFVLARTNNLPARERVFLNIAVTVSLLGLIYLGLWMWAKRAPFAAALVALMLYVSVLALDAVMAPEQIVQGIVIKILIVAGLAKAVKSGYALKKETEAQP
ncbi:MAG: hypothetical protein ABSE59_01695 [Opitutaceae bacterium]|jgi:cytochrome bd-type quinol oxidase subunit 2